MSTLTIGQLARQGGVGVETLRYYERRGLIQPQQRSAAGYRQYGPAAQQRLQFIRRAQALGFSLDQIAELLALSQRAEASAAEVKQLTRQHIEVIETRIHDLESMRDALAELECRCPGESGTTAQCPILQALSQ